MMITSKGANLSQTALYNHYRYFYGSQPLTRGFFW
jgi:hypothetical protein